MKKKTVIEISEFEACKVILHDEDGTKKNRSVTYGKLLDMLNSAASEVEVGVDDKNNYVTSDILPGDEMISTVQVKEVVSSKSKWYVLLREGIPSNMTLGKKTYKDVAMPRTIYAIKVCNDKCVSLRIACIKDRFITPSTKIYRYPYSNVFDTKNVCLGGNRINDFDLGVLSNIVMVPEMFLSMINNNDGYAGSNNSGFKYDELLELMSEAKFDTDILRESDQTRTYNDFLNILR